MPVHKVKGGYKWGSSGKVYPDKASAERQGRAAYANGYKGDRRGDAAQLVDAIKIVRRGLAQWDTWTYR